MLRLLIDTSVWLDLAQRRDGQKWIVPMRVFMHEKHLQLLVPALVIEEFDRNRPRAEDAVTVKVQDRFRPIRNDLSAFADDERRQEWLQEMTHYITFVSAMTLQNFSEISDLLHAGKTITPTDKDRSRVIQRGLEKKAPPTSAARGAALSRSFNAFPRAARAHCISPARAGRPGAPKACP